MSFDTPLAPQDSEVFLYEKQSGQQETLWNPTSDVRRSRLKRQVVQLDEQGEFESERYTTKLLSNFFLNVD